MKPCQPQINQSTKKQREKQGTKWKDLHPRRQMNHPWTTLELFCSTNWYLDRVWMDYFVPSDCSLVPFFKSQFVELFNFEIVKWIFGEVIWVLISLLGTFIHFWKLQASFAHQGWPIWQLKLEREQKFLPHPNIESLNLNLKELSFRPNGMELAPCTQPKMLVTFSLSAWHFDDLSVT
jgi:hypothetical protein